MKQPTTKDEVKSFLGIVNYYGRFIRNLSTVMYPLNRLLRKDIPFHFDTDCKKSFSTIKQVIESDTVLTHYDPQLPIVLAVDASPIGVGAVLSHVYKDGTEKPIQFASQTLNQTQQRYSQVDREAYAIIFGVRKFNQYLFGRKFILVTDNKAIAQIFSPHKGLPTLSATRMQHYAIYLGSFEYEIRVNKSSENANADALSRLPCANVNENIDEVDVIETQVIENLPVTVTELSGETKKADEVKRLIECLQYGRDCEPSFRFGIAQSEFSLQRGCLLRGMRVFLPKGLRKRVLAELHTGHFGITKMKILARAYCWWNQLDKDIEDLVSNCTTCQSNRPDPTAVPVHCWLPPNKVFERVHADYAGPFMGKYLFVLVDALSKWPEVHIVNNMTAETTVRLCEEIFSRFGLPRVFVSDYGTQFTS
ncbi:uncharacterized protein K02A2.6-like [Rhagoletis pomonella]|uniref:uncharacterized protein K02A2.6-like n=1 Tax=Rhagoletis pomonella TaxID=28610 RepID=UPI0017835FF8|nr:uncharacterized protein K02A2.6-like [Rhagoletis pomonella]